MMKRRKLFYWIATVWLALGMLSTGIVQLLHVPEETALIDRLGYPLYFLTLLGVWKILGVVAVFVPKFPLLKEWAYAGFSSLCRALCIPTWPLATPPRIFSGLFCCCC